MRRCLQMYIFFFCRQLSLCLTRLNTTDMLSPVEMTMAFNQKNQILLGFLNLNFYQLIFFYFI